MLDGISAREIAASGLKAQRVRMNVIASNLSNIDTTRTARGGPFRRQLTVFRGGEIGRGSKPENVGVRVKDIVPDPSPFRKAYLPDHPDADASGYVTFPNISIAVEMADMISAQRAYDANIAVIVSDRRMNQQALEIIRA